MMVKMTTQTNDGGIMKKVILTLVVLMTTMGGGTQAKASIWDVIEAIVAARESQSGHGRHHFGAITCSYQDSGWEEHWRGHDSCGECLSEHGRCTEVCSAEFEECTVDIEDQFGRRSTERVSGRDRWDAARQAEWLCRDSRLRYCQVRECREQREEISRRSCR